jgi:glyoxalase family protein
MTILGFHHITLGCSDAQRTIDFYSGLLGLRTVKLTVNFDDPGTYHLYFGDERGSPGTIITFFEWPGVAQGYPGIGGTDHLALAVASATGLRLWARCLAERGIDVSGPDREQDGWSIGFRDPDGVQLRIVGPGDSMPPPIPGPARPIPENMRLNRPFAHIEVITADLARSQAFYQELLGLEPVEGPPEPNRLRLRGGQAASCLQVRQAGPGSLMPARVGVGQTHHIALAVADEDGQERWRERLVEAGQSVTPVLDRKYFKSIYTRDPDSHIIELATLGPGFAVDEPADALGRALMLPEWLEPERSRIEQDLQPLQVPV